MNPLNQGANVVNPTVYANGANWIALLSTILTILATLDRIFGWSLGLTQENIDSILIGVTSLSVVITNLLHTISNPNAGLK